jgi:octaprenyl-diphosphate synthase
MKHPVKTQQGGNSAPTVIAPFEIIKAELAEVNALIKGQLASCPYKRGVDELLRYVTGRSGKMLRPGVALLSGKCCGQITDEHIRIAAIFEIIHNATLVHDDVVDQSRMRRGRESVNHVYGNESAVLLGDFLLSKVFKMCAELRPEVAKEIATAAARTCEGELNQNIRKADWRMNEAEYLEIITDKTGAIFSSCCRLGAFLAGAGRDEEQHLAQFGLAVGTAFQIVDDLLDITGDRVQIGKNLGSDFERAKPTLPLIHFLSSIQQDQKAQLLSWVNSDASIESVAYAIREMLDKAGSLQYAKRRAEQFIDESIQSLQILPDSRAKAALIDTAQFILNRAATK